jgi:hypothetical protein
VGIFLEGPFTFERNGGNIRVIDATGQLLCLSLHDFYEGLDAGVAFRESLQTCQCGEVVSIFPDVVLARGGPV